MENLTSAHEAAIDGVRRENAELTDRVKQLESELNQKDKEIGTVRHDNTQLNKQDRRHGVESPEPV